MKTFNVRVTIILILLCSSAKLNAQKDVNEYLKGKETDTGVFVITADSVKHSGTKFKWNPGTATSIYIKIDDEKYKRKKKQDIIAYQNETSYDVYVPEIGDDASRLRKGEINLYTYYVVSWASSARTGAGEASMSRYYLIEKEKNKFLRATFDNLEQLFSDNAAVLKKYHEIFPDRPVGKAPFSTKNTVKEEAALFKNMILLIEMYNQN